METELFIIMKFKPCSKIPCLILSLNIRNDFLFPKHTKVELILETSSWMNLEKFFIEFHNENSKLWNHPNPDKNSNKLTLCSGFAHFLSFGDDLVFLAFNYKILTSWVTLELPTSLSSLGCRRRCVFRQFLLWPEHSHLECICKNSVMFI